MVGSGKYIPTFVWCVVLTKVRRLKAERLALWITADLRRGVSWMISGWKVRKSGGGPMRGQLEDVFYDCCWQFPRLGIVAVRIRYEAW